MPVNSSTVPAGVVGATIRINHSLLYPLDKLKRQRRARGRADIIDQLVAEWNDRTNLSADEIRWLAERQHERRYRSLYNRSIAIMLAATTTAGIDARIEALPRHQRPSRSGLAMIIIAHATGELS